MDLKLLEHKYPNIVISGNYISDSRYCLVDSRVHGLYACFHCILYGLFICEEEGITPVVFLGSNHLYYDKAHGENIFTYFYRQEELDIEHLPRMTVLNLGGYLNWINISNQEKVYSDLLLKKYFVLNDETAGSIIRFGREHFAGNRTLAVHYRGTDKITETPLVPFTAYLSRIDYLLDNNLFDKIFFATDELSIREYVEYRYGDKAVLYNIEGVPGLVPHLPETGLHFIPDSSPYLNARNAIMECYLLAQCDALMSSHKSSMSVFATFINPGIVHIILEP